MSVEIQYNNKSQRAGARARERQGGRENERPRRLATLGLPRHADKISLTVLRSSFVIVSSSPSSSVYSTSAARMISRPCVSRLVLQRAHTAAEKHQVL